ncbi:uncharacterized protein MYCFIDRAFT_177512 [Pseudocercospora fijiensis CIRAD86]|uniref:Uncharacterized protein n=1 Tax=Pseudocercospora fijiensis (strain CIRAD86) TaxID=383855 RepID=M3ATT9_PSEFD|nr:uncharacterized protein MYCFIDRAFT_177512 [Pseudocercospora fijiensis CIRAD86]EME80573.1 hypothetical protein MYCFIDRAFT_177512 [Pseudocercospora fijiensis CIRAD86]
MRTSPPASSLTATQRALNTSEVLEAILYQVKDRDELLQLVSFSKTARNVIYGASSASHGLSLSKSRRAPLVWEVDFKNSTIVNLTADHAQQASGLKILKPVVLTDFLLFDRYYAKLSLVERLDTDTRVVGWKIRLAFLQHALQTRPDFTIFRMFLSNPPVEAVELAWIPPHPNVGYGSSGITQLFIAGGVCLRDVINQIPVMQSQWVESRRAHYCRPPLRLIRAQTGSASLQDLSLPIRMDSSKHEVPRGLALQDFDGNWGKTRTQQPQPLNSHLFARQHGTFDFTAFEGAICRLTTVYLTSNAFLYGTQVAPPPDQNQALTEIPSKCGLERIQVYESTTMTEAYFVFPKKLQKAASDLTLVFLPCVGLLTELERDAVEEGISIGGVEERLNW